MGARHTPLSARVATSLGLAMLLASPFVPAPPLLAEELDEIEFEQLSAQIEPDTSDVSESLTRTIALKDGDPLIICNADGTLSMTDGVDG